MFCGAGATWARVAGAARSQKPVCHSLLRTFVSTAAEASPGNFRHSRKGLASPARWRLLMEGTSAGPPWNRLAALLQRREKGPPCAGVVLGPA